MALRDPGAPRRNPLFAVGEPPEAPEPPPGRTAPDDDGWSASAPSDGDGDSLLDGVGELLAGAPGSAVGPLLGALTDAGPEAAEHLVNAAHELTLAIKVVVDAFESRLADQRAALAAEAAGAAGHQADGPVDDANSVRDVFLDLTAPAADAAPPAAPAGVQRIELD